MFTVCVGLQQFADGVGDDSTYVMGVTPWDQSLNVIDKGKLRIRCEFNSSWWL